MERSRETEQNDLGQAVMRLQVDGVEHPSVASYARGLQKETWLMVAAGAVVANSTRHWMAKMLRDGDTVVLSQKSTSQEWALWQFTIVAIDLRYKFIYS